MSDPKRANLITVGAPKSAKNIVNKTVRLNINLVESNESKYPELNYKELVIAEERKKRVQNGKTSGLDPFSDNDDDVERVARKFEQKYGGKSTYGRKGRSKQDDFADIGAGYDENDSFIDNTHGYDEMIPPECDTLFGGFYINCGSLEFKTVPQEQTGADEARRNKRRISSSSSEEDSSDSSSDSESQDEKDPKAVTNGAIDSHKTEHRKKKNKKDKQKAKKIRRTDSSAANSGKQTSDDNIQADGESVDSRTSHSDSLTSKPAPSSENPITSDSSRDTEMRTDVKLPQALTQVLDALEASVAKYLTEHPATAASQLLASNDAHIQRLEQTLKKHPCEAAAALAARSRAARLLGVSRDALLQRAKASAEPTKITPTGNAQPSTPALTTSTAPTNSVKPYKANNKRKVADEEDIDVTKLTDEQREAKIVETMKRLMDLIEERKPSMFASYNSECDRVREENSSRKKLTSEGSTHVEKRLPKRRFPWCHRTRQLLARISKLAGSEQAAAMLLADRVLPMFPKGFVRMPTLMRQANISKDIKVPDTKRQRLGSASTNLYPHIPPLNPQTVPLNSQTAPLNPQIAPPNTQTASPNPVKTPPTFPEQIQFPSSLTVTATAKTSPEKTEPPHHSFGMIMNNFTISKDLIIEREKTKEDKKEEIYIPPNNIGSITITPMPIHKDKKQDKTNQSSLIRVKSPAVLNESVHKKDVKTKKTDKPTKEKRVDTPLQIDTSFQLTKKDPSPKQKEPSPKGEEATQRLIESLRVKENNIPRPTLVPVHHSPTFAKPEKRPPDLKKKKEIMIVSDTDPLSDHEPVSVDDSSSDVEVIENDKSDKCEVPSKDNSLKVPKRDETRDAADKDISDLMRNIREMEHSQEPPKFNSNSFSGVVTNSNAKLWPRGFQRNGLSAPDDRDKFAERTSLNKTDGYNGVNG